MYVEMLVCVLSVFSSSLRKEFSMYRTILFPFILILFAFGCASPKKDTLVNEPPQWAREAIWYQIFPERFHNGDTSNDPRLENIQTASASFPLPDNWEMTSWTSDWYAQEAWAIPSGKKLNETMQYRRYGGDLQGILYKLDYLTELGITAIYLNPINDAPSSHKYDARNYHHIDVNLGPDPQGDIKLMATENPEDPATWVWTTADRLFLKLIDEAHRRNIKVIVDYSWNHTGVEFWAWKDIQSKQQQSKYKDWYEIISFDDPRTPQNEFAYKGWLNISSLPELKKVNIATERVIGYPYEGDIHPGVKKHIYDVTARWLKPDGDVSKGIDGFRLDVADHIGMVFWRDYRRFVKNINPEAYLVGEIWWEQWPDRLMNPAPYCKGDVFDAVMQYQVYRPARSFFAAANNRIDAKQFSDSLHFQWRRLDTVFSYAMMNVNATHDAPRLLTCFENGGKYKYNASGFADPQYKTGKPSEETYQRAKLYLIQQFTSIGAPHIWNGDEMGMWGGDDPDCRKPLWWQGMRFAPEQHYPAKAGAAAYSMPAFNQDHFLYYQKLIALRKAFPLLRTGVMRFIKAEGDLLMYERTNGKDQMLVLFNMSNVTASFELPVGLRYQDVWNTNGDIQNAMQLAPLSAAVLLKK